MSDVVNIEDWSDFQAFLRQVAMCVFVHTTCRIAWRGRVLHVATAGLSEQYLYFLRGTYQHYQEQNDGA